MRLPDLFIPAAEPPTIETDVVLRRRRITVGVTIVIGTALLAATLRVPRGSNSFTILGLLVAATWIIGALVSGPIPLRPVGTSPWRTVVVPALAVGIVSFLGFLAAYFVAQHLPLVSAALDSVLAKADAGPVALVLAVALVNGVAEELFFRGALHAAAEPHRPAVVATVVYVGVTATTGNVALVLAAAVMGTIFSLERLSTRSVLAPIVTHVTWSTLMVLALPR